MKPKKEGKYLYFQTKEGSWNEPIKLKCDDDLEHLLQEHRNYHYRWMLIEIENNMPKDIKSGYLESDKRKVKKK